MRRHCPIHKSQSGQVIIVYPIIQDCGVGVDIILHRNIKGEMAIVELGSGIIASCIIAAASPIAIEPLKDTLLRHNPVILPMFEPVVRDVARLQVGICQRQVMNHPSRIDELGNVSSQIVTSMQFYWSESRNIICRRIVSITDYNNIVGIIFPLPEFIHIK